MSSGNEHAFLKDIREAIHRIQVYTADMDYDGFQADTKTQDAALRNLEIIGEATKQLSETVRQQAPQIPWRNIGRMRDKLICDSTWQPTLRDLQQKVTKYDQVA